jgi:sugar phosphate isomerase/epimerase
LPERKVKVNRKLNRRSFIGTSITTAAAMNTIGTTELTKARNAPGALKIGVASYSLRKFSRADAIKMLKEIGVSYVSIKSFHLPYESAVSELKMGSKEFHDAGIQVLSGGTISLREPGELKAMFEYAKTSSIPMMVCAPTHATLDAVEKLVQEYDIRIAIHNHGPEDEHFPTPQSALDALEGRDPRMGLCVDVGHTTRTGADIVESIRKAGPRLFDVHIKDLSNLMDKDSQVIVGEGAMPIVSIFKQLRAMNYQGGVMLEYEIDDEDPLKGMIKSVAYMRGVLDGLAG